MSPAGDLIQVFVLCPADVFDPGLTGLISMRFHFPGFPMGLQQALPGVTLGLARVVDPGLFPASNSLEPGQALIMQGQHPGGGGGRPQPRGVGQLLIHPASHRIQGLLTGPQTGGCGGQFPDPGVLLQPPHPQHRLKSVAEGLHPLRIRFSSARASARAVVSWRPWRRNCSNPGRRATARSMSGSFPAW